MARTPAHQGPAIRRVRSENPLLSAAIARWAERSTTFRRLIEAISRISPDSLLSSSRLHTTSNRTIAPEWDVAMVKVILLLAIVPVAASADTGRHVRGTEPRITALIESGVSRSVTFRALVEALDASDLIVYVEPRNVPVRLGGYLLHQVFAREGYRYVRLVVNVAAVSQKTLIGVIAHELQHALEIAGAPDVRTAEDVERLFARIGFRGGCPRNCYETFDAIDVGRRVRTEVARGGGG